MYKLKPVVPVPMLIENTCRMYKLKDLQQMSFSGVPMSDKSDELEDINDETQLSDQEIQVLLEKQNEVLKILEQLELRLSKLDVKFPNAKDIVPISEKQQSTQCNVNKEHKSNSKSVINNDIKNLIKNDTVVFADPEDPPYSLLALPILWPAVAWDISYHVHSSVLKDLEALGTIKAFKNVNCKHSNNIVKVFVIWQHIKPSPKVVRSPTDLSIGEVSLLRTFNQCLATQPLAVADQIKSNKVLDLINEIVDSTNDRTAELHNLIMESNTKLDITNIVIWSLLYKKSEHPSKIEKWLSHFTKIIIV
ncbi:uncharacterized protein LOC100167297 [Acyrthosiphon pisum]|uniref:ACYPI008104 protein n=1 Tax=Acyrthosiphon pisum TaxID=7029 RepID=C4WTK0_ACYPI|nr:uncharacterized protein LOC100167297 [Acyrthosiphon pisum]BAH71220.1 ACYPI008104 [Acyrthosiphon pisum]|eukprot:XP_008190020.1 PREDICTED: uncharacterized protein LOC100167297 [Acyrthosiphon pisum]